MRTILFHKTLIALAISASVLSAHALEVELTENGLANIGAPDNLTIIGSLDKTQAQFKAISLSALDLTESLIVDTTMTLEGLNSQGLFLNNDSTANRIAQDLIHRGTMTLRGDSAKAIVIAEALVGANLSNQGAMVERHGASLDTQHALVRLTHDGGASRAATTGQAMLSSARPLHEACPPAILRHVRASGCNRSTATRPRTSVMASPATTPTAAGLPWAPMARSMTRSPSVWPTAS